MQRLIFLIFENKVDYFDLGGSELGLKRTKKENVIKLKAMSKNFKETNLTVMTADGQYYSFLVNFKSNPDTLNYFLKSLPTPLTPKPSNAIKIQDKAEPEVSPFKAIASQLLKLNTRSFVSGAKKYKMLFLIKDIHAKGDKIYFHTEISNLSIMTSIS